MRTPTLFTRAFLSTALIATAGLGVAAPASAQDGDYYHHEFETLATVAGPDPDLQYIEFAAISGNGDWVVSLRSNWDYGSFTDTLVAQNWRTGEVRERSGLLPIVSELSSDSMTSDASHVITSTSFGVFVTNVATGSSVVLNGADEDGYPMLSPDGRFAIANGQTWNAVTGQSIGAAPAETVGFHSDGSIITVVDYDEFEPIVIALIDPATGALRSSHFGTHEVCEAGIGTCNAAMADQIFGFADASQFLVGYRYVVLATGTSEDGSVYAEVVDDAGRENIRIVNVDSGYQIAEAESLYEIMQAYDYGSDEAAVMRLYQAFFARTPDVAGVRYWISVLHDGHSLESIAVWMSDSDEFRRLYAGTTDSSYVEAVYSNVLGRGYDIGGYNYWLGLLVDGSLTRSGVVHWVTANPEFIRSYPFTL